MNSDLYTDRVDPLKYFARSDCAACGCRSCGEWLDKLKQGRLRPRDCPGLAPARAEALEVVLALEKILPQVQMSLNPIPGLTGLHGVNEPGPSSPVLVTGNASATQEVVLAVLSTTTAPFHLLFVDCQGHTVDMAMIYRAFTPEALRDALSASGLSDLLAHRELIVPGLAAPIKGDLAAGTGWQVRVGPICIGELPLFLGEQWRPPMAPAGQR